MIHDMCNRKNMKTLPLETAPLNKTRFFPYSHLSQRFDWLLAHAGLEGLICPMHLGKLKRKNPAQTPNSTNMYKQLCLFFNTETSRPDTASKKRFYSKTPSQWHPTMAFSNGPRNATPSMAPRPMANTGHGPPSNGAEQKQPAMAPIATAITPSNGTYSYSHGIMT